MKTLPVTEYISEIYVDDKLIETFHENTSGLALYQAEQHMYGGIVENVAVEIRVYKRILLYHSTQQPVREDNQNE